MPRDEAGGDGDGEPYSTTMTRLRVVVVRTTIAPIAVWTEPEPDDRKPAQALHFIAPRLIAAASMPKT